MKRAKEDAQMAAREPAIEWQRVRSLSRNERALQLMNRAKCIEVLSLLPFIICLSWGKSTSNVDCEVSERLTPSYDWWLELFFSVGLGVHALHYMRRGFR